MTVTLKSNLSLVTGLKIQVTVKTALDPNINPTYVPHLKDSRILIATNGPLEAQNISHHTPTSRRQYYLVFKRRCLPLADSNRNSDFDYVILDVQTSDRGILQLLADPEFSISARSVIGSLAPASSSPWSRRLCRLGVTKYVYKPFNPDQFFGPNYSRSRSFT